MIDPEIPQFDHDLARLLSVAEARARYDACPPVAQRVIDAVGAAFVTEWAAVSGIDVNERLAVFVAAMFHTIHDWEEAVEETFPDPSNRHQEDFLTLVRDYPSPGDLANLAIAIAASKEGDA